jgi:hypothetical protein
MSEDDKLRLEIARAAVMKAAIAWRNSIGYGPCDPEERKLYEAVDHYEDILYAVEHK